VIPPPAVARPLAAPSAPPPTAPGTPTGEIAARRDRARLYYAILGVLAAVVVAIALWQWLR